MRFPFICRFPRHAPLMVCHRTACAILRHEPDTGIVHRQSGRDRHVASRQSGIRMIAEKHAVAIADSYFDFHEIRRHCLACSAGCRRTGRTGPGCCFRNRCFRRRPKTDTWQVQVQETTSFSYREILQNADWSKTEHLTLSHFSTLM